MIGVERDFLRERISLAPDCGMWFVRRDVAERKLRAMCLAAAALRAESA